MLKSPARDGAVDQVGAVERTWISSPNEFENVLEDEDQRKRQQQLKALVAPVDRPQERSIGGPMNPSNIPETISPGSISHGDVPTCDA